MAAPKPQRPWTTDDEAFLREHYPKRGVRHAPTGCGAPRPLSPRRRDPGPVRRERPRGLRSVERGRSMPRSGRPIAPGGRWRPLPPVGAARLSPTWISMRALEIGARKPERARRPGRPRIRDRGGHAKASAVTVSAALRAAGFKRSAAAVTIFAGSAGSIRPTRRSTRSGRSTICSGSARTSCTGGSGSACSCPMPGGTAAASAGWSSATRRSPGSSSSTVGRRPLEDPACRIERMVHRPPRPQGHGRHVDPGREPDRADRGARQRPARVLEDRRQVRAPPRDPFESCTVTISKAIQDGLIQPARSVA